ncbi:MAG: phosphoribosyl-ATP pyrophosphohydrolase [Firmicutes bacterium HGW-Firmicutes-1]|jgi:predicted house-cleaning noncanonical NTP pyrophosphatase (MazG superfamily)|nr:MAG: phosphoribosyl-ATP pyrophosphohydrolase [Firmicutes bacterium HGW-Firmicutes-1]
MGNNCVFYNKLVRDKIPEIIRKNGEVANFHILDEGEYKEILGQKLLEECNEWINDKSIEELADILEVFYTIIEVQGISMEAVEKVRKEKIEERGGFKRRVFLENVVNKSADK